jgi:zinc transport system substrate-binding protein
MKYPVMFFLVFIMGVATPLVAQPVVATNGWTAAFAAAAGAEDIAVLAPYEMAHPPEYELRPSDIRTIADATLVIYAGYEVMVDRLMEASGGGPDTLRITTGYTRDILTAAIVSIGDALGTQTEAAASLGELTDYLDEWSNELRNSGVSDMPALVHVHQRGLAAELGLNVVGVFGPAPLEARQISELTSLEPVLIVDNGHNPIAAPITETTGAAVAVWINFPGTGDTRTLLDVLGHNRAEMNTTASAGARR